MAGDIIPELGKKYYFRLDGDLLVGEVVNIFFGRSAALFKLISKRRLEIPFCRIEGIARTKNGERTKTR
ncbi:MAG: hypothetical protein NTW06_00515 [Candidatus Falkowbacteria bacterium]|nr:hypothetical protein [Candidatus Falkowbacteria bacterium]